MVDVRNIEALTVSFTMGVIAGSFLCGMSPGMLPAAIPTTLLLALTIPLLFRHRLTQTRSPWLLPLILTLFLLAGLLATVTASYEGVSAPSRLSLFAEDAVHALRANIDRLGFASSETAPLLKALLTGDKSDLSRGTVSAFRGSGASHILALSGLHIGIIYLLLDYLTRLAGRSPLSRILRYGFVLLASAFFTLMTGATPSIVRAFLFILINETLRLTGRPRNPVRVLCLALFIQLVLSPLSIRSIGFQLSYLAMSGIFLLYPILERWYPDGGRRDPMRWIWKSAALSISCQVFTAPLVWHCFHSFPRHFLLTNLLALPLTSLVMGSAILTLAWSVLAPCPTWLLQATDLLSTALIRTLEIISSM